MKHPQELRADTTRHHKDKKKTSTKKLVNGTCTNYMGLIQFEFVSHRNRRANFLIKTNMAFSSRFFMVNVKVNL